MMKHKAEILITDSDGSERTAEASALNVAMLEKAIEREREFAIVKVLRRWTEE